MAIYKIVSHGGNGLPLNVYGSGTITGRRNVCIWSDTGSIDQQWSISSLGSNQTVSSVNNLSYMLNAYRSNWNCDVYTLNSYSYVNFLSLGNDLYRIQLKSATTRYLTATGTASNSNVDWEVLNSTSEAQKWKITVVGGGGSSKILTMPSGRLCNWSQYSQPVLTALNNATYGCVITAVLDVCNFYGPYPFTMQNLVDAGLWNQGMQNWDQIPGPAAARAGQVFASQAEYFSIIRDELNGGRPVIIFVGTGEDDNHAVMCYGYTNGGTTHSHFKVMDPGRMPAYLDPNNLNMGYDRTLDIACTDNGHIINIWRIRRTYSE